MFGTAYLKSIKKYLGSHKSEWKTDELPLIFACYFGGWGNVRKAGFDPSKIKSQLPPPEGGGFLAEMLKNGQENILQNSC